LIEPMAAREDLERTWFRRMKPMPELAPLVTGEQLADEPFHRWLPYKQAFAPKLVRLFLAHAEGLSAGEDGPILDPFAGAGTTAIECSRADVPCVGIEATPSLAFLAEARGARDFPEPPDLRGCANWQDYAERLSEPVHQAALILAVARQFSSDGKPLKHAPPLREVLPEVLDLLRADLQRPLPRSVDVRAGDARDLGDFADESATGVLTSPPYLSRHDYTRITQPHETVFAHWYAAPGLAERRESQVRAHPRAYARDRSEPLPAVVDECEQALRMFEQPRSAGVVRSYFEDLRLALSEMARVLRPGDPAWVVVGGARLEGVYVPSDLVAAELAVVAGFEVRSIRVARTLTSSGRRLGMLEGVAPRESLLMLRR
jgi:hypothetical protein